MMRPLIKPPRLQPGARIGIVAPGSPVSLAEEDIARGYRRLYELGLVVEEAPQCRTTWGHTAGTPAQRAEAIHSFVRRPDIAALMTFWGGYQSHQVLEHLDFELIRSHPKVIIGYSDVTSLLVGLHAATGLATFCGPAAITFVKPTVPDYTRDAFTDVLFAGRSPLTLSASASWSDNPWFAHPERRMLFQPTEPWRTFRPGRARGPLVAGNLGTMLLLAGTRWWPDLDGAVLVVEEDEVETTQTIDRLFTHARQIGVFNRIAGLAVGRLPSAVGFTADDTLEAILQLALRGCDIPVLTGLDFGHTDPLLTLPLGVHAELDASGGTLTLLEPAVT